VDEECPLTRGVSPFLKSERTAPTRVLAAPEPRAATPWPGYALPRVHIGGYYQPCEVCREWLRKDVTSPVTWNGTFSSKDGVGAQWKWGAAVYTQFTDSQHSKKYNQLMVKAGHQTSCVEQTWSRIARFWWGATWRSLVFGNLFFGAAAGIVGITLLMFGHREWASARLFADILLLAWVPGSLCGIWNALRITYRDFRIVFTPCEVKL